MWAGHVERMADDRLPKRAAELREQGRRRRARPRLRWEDCVKIDVRKAGEEEDWKKKKTIDRGGWKRPGDEAVTKLRQHLTPDKGKRGREISSHMYMVRRTRTTNMYLTLIPERGVYLSNLGNVYTSLPPATHLMSGDIANFKMSLSRGVHNSANLLGICGSVSITFA